MGLRETFEEVKSGQNLVSKFVLPVMASPVDVLKQVVLRADTGNAGNLYVGPYSVAVGAGFLLDAGEMSPPISIDDLNKLYVISDQNGTDEKQNVSIDNLTTSGTFTLSHGGNETDPINWNETSTNLKTKIDAMGADYDVSVTGGPGPSVDWVVEFHGNLAAQDLVMMTGDGSNLVGGSTTVTITEDTPGDPAYQTYSWIAV